MHTPASQSLFETASMSPFSRRGQATTEWLLLISVLVVAIVAAGYGLAATFAGDMEKLGERTGTVYASGDLAL